MKRKTIGSLVSQSAAAVDGIPSRDTKWKHNLDTNVMFYGGVLSATPAVCAAALTLVINEIDHAFWLLSKGEGHSSPTTSLLDHGVGTFPNGLTADVRGSEMSVACMPVLCRAISMFWLRELVIDTTSIHLGGQVWHILSKTLADPACRLHSLRIISRHPYPFARDPERTFSHALTKAHSLKRLSIQAEFQTADVGAIIVSLTKSTSACRLESLTLTGDTMGKVPIEAIDALTEYYTLQTHPLPTLTELNLEIDNEVSKTYTLFPAAASQSSSPLRVLTVQHWTAQSIADIASQLRILTIKNIYDVDEATVGSFFYGMQDMIRVLAHSTSIVKLDLMHSIHNSESLFDVTRSTLDLLHATLITRMTNHCSLTELDFYIAAPGDHTLHALCIALKNPHCTLQVLHCLCEDASDTTGARLFDALVFNVSLTRVKLSHIDAKVIDLPSLLRLNHTLTSLVISGNWKSQMFPKYFNDHDKLVASLRKNRSLTEFHYVGSLMNGIQSRFVDALYESGNRTLVGFEDDMMPAIAEKANKIKRRASVARLNWCLIAVAIAFARANGRDNRLLVRSILPLLTPSHAIVHAAGISCCFEKQAAA